MRPLIALCVFALALPYQDPVAMPAHLDGGAPSSAASSPHPARSGVDPRRDEQWGWRRIGGTVLADRGVGSSVLVAVLDSGVDATHPDLRGRVRQGADFVDGSTNGTVDRTGHGTHVAGIIAANNDNGIGVSGVAPNAVILPVRVLDDAGQGDHDDIAEGIVWAVDQGARVVNLSLGGPEQSNALRDAVAYAQRKGALVVASAGNVVGVQDDAPPSYPAAYPGVVAVAASGVDDAVALFSTFGDYVTIAAPGFAVLSTSKRGYEYLSGTSQAAPFVAGAAAFLWGQETDLSAIQVRRRLEASALDLGPPGRDTQSGAGVLDLQHALTGRRTPPVFSLPTIPGIGVSPPARPRPGTGSTPTAGPPAILGVTGDTTPAIGRPTRYTLVTSPPRPGATVAVYRKKRRIGTVQLDATGRATVRIRFTNPVELVFSTATLKATVLVEPEPVFRVTGSHTRSGRVLVTGTLLGAKNEDRPVVLRCRDTAGHRILRTGSLVVRDTVFSAKFDLVPKTLSCTLHAGDLRSGVFTVRSGSKVAAGR